MSCPQELDAIEALWQLKRRGANLPRRSDFSPEELKPWLGNLAVVAVERQPSLRFRVTLSGTVLDDYRGYGITGHYVDTLRTSPVPSLPRFVQCVEDRTPVRFLQDNSRNSIIYRRMVKLLLPLAEDRVQVDRVLVALYPLPANDARRAALPRAAGF